MIEVHQDPTRDWIAKIQEACCFCRIPTLFWHTKDNGETIACCQGCAETAEKEDVPSKKEWCRRERIATKLK